MIFNHTCPNPLNNLFRNLRYHGEAHFFPPEEKNKCCLVTCYPPKFCIYPDFSPCIDLPRSASPIKAFSGKAGSVHLHPTFSSFFPFFSIYSLGRIYTLIYRTRTIYTNRGNRQQGNISAQPLSGINAKLKRVTGNKVTFPFNVFQEKTRLLFQLMKKISV